MIEYLLELDANILLWVNSLYHEVLDPIAYYFSGRFVWIPMYVAIAAVIIDYFGWKKGLLFVAAIGLAVACADLICARAIRPFAERLRPANLENPLSEFVHVVFDYRGGRYGFPSCHAANSAALAMASSLVLKKRGYILFIYIWSLAQCYSRMYLGVHFPGDLLVGFFIGSLCGFGIIALANAIANRCHIGGTETKKPIRQWMPIAIGIVTFVGIVIFGLCQ